MHNLDVMIIKIGKKAVKQAQKENLINGIANVYSKNKKLYFQLPDGTITEQIPKEYNMVSSTISEVKNDI